MATTTISMKPGTSGKKGGKHSKNVRDAAIKIKCAMIAHFIFCPIKTNPKSILKKVEKLPRERG